MEIMFSIPAGSSETWRIVRLAELWTAFVERVPRRAARRVPCPHGVSGAILRMHDRDGSLTVVWYCERSIAILGPVMDTCRDSAGFARATYVALQEGRRVSGDDEIWRTWIAPCEGMLYDMPAGSELIN